MFKIFQTLISLSSCIPVGGEIELIPGEPFTTQITERHLITHVACVLEKGTSVMYCGSRCTLRHRVNALITSRAPIYAKMITPSESTLNAGTMFYRINSEQKDAGKGAGFTFINDTPYNILGKYVTLPSHAALVSFPSETNIDFRNTGSIENTFPILCTFEKNKLDTLTAKNILTKKHEELPLPFTGAVLAFFHTLVIQDNWNLACREGFDTPTCEVISENYHV